MKYAIPSFRRHDIIKSRTLNMLEMNAVDPRDVYIFVSDEEDFMKYYDLQKFGYNLIYKMPLANVIEKFNFIHHYFDRGERVVFIEDDIEALKMKGDVNKLEPFQALKSMAQNCFDVCEKNGTKLWGISSNANPFYMKNSLAVGFKFIVANLFGFISTKDSFLKISQHCKSDYERTILYYIKYGKVVRMDGVCAITKNYKTMGGLQDMTNRAELEMEACKYLVKRFPHLVEMNEKKSGISMYQEVKLKQMRGKEMTDWMYVQKKHDAKIGWIHVKDEG